MDCNCTTYHCPVDTTLTMIGGKYKALILWHLIDKTLRFGELRKLIPQATPKMLTQQLRELEEDHLINRTVYPVVPPKVEYSLSELGTSIRPILGSIYTWGTEYLEKNGMAASCSMKFPI
ncbi:helix-turn-helix domain-containing protein [Clostridium sp. HBUAS56010]|uniref:winged helix-turn-helix transcriptional regulator n=1 Tax=Clostridium sp. HBUAS56010 TaxID=2571127 RepID=UPI0011775259|nr:helix-turn-helix domain-containing protein [Clostridium sp. HBUAS56010]